MHAKSGILTSTRIKLVHYNSPNSLVAGFGVPVRVNMSVGMGQLANIEGERAKVHAVLSSGESPDMMMDLSLIPGQIELWRTIRERFSGPLGCLPHYLAFSPLSGLNARGLLQRIQHLFEGGINFITIHCTPTRELLTLAKKSRMTPITSRGGGIVAKDMLLNDRRESIFAILFEDICDLAKQFGAVINLGTTFRAASVADGLDEVARNELALQAQYCKLARKRGVQVVLEGPGHIPLHDVSTYWDLVKHMQILPMPLGPIVTDTCAELDHVAAAIGAAHLMMLSGGGIINALTTVEHRGGVPTSANLLDALRIARLAAQVASVTYTEQAIKLEDTIRRQRGMIESCVLKSTHPGCTRCGTLCPLRSDSYTNDTSA